MGHVTAVKPSNQASKSSAGQQQPDSISPNQRGRNEVIILNHSVVERLGRHAARCALVKDDMPRRCFPKL